MLITDNVVIDTTNSVLDQLVSPYTFSAPPREARATSPHAQIICFPGLTQQTCYIGAVVLESSKHLSMGDEFSLPPIRTIGKAKLKVRKVSKLGPPLI